MTSDIATLLQLVETPPSDLAALSNAVANAVRQCWTGATGEDSQREAALALIVSTRLRPENARVFGEACLRDVQNLAFLSIVLDSLTVARRFSVLESLATGVAETILKDVLTLVNQRDSTRRDALLRILEKLLVGSTNNATLACKVGYILDQNIAAVEKVGELKNIAMWMAQLYWPQVNALPTSSLVSSEKGYLVTGDLESALDKARENAWVKNAKSRIHLPTHPGIRKEFMFTYPYFPWPEGKWVMDPQPGQGDQPEFTLHAKMEGRAVSVLGALLQDASSSSGSSSHDVKKVSGVRVIPSTRSMAHSQEHSFEMVFGSISRSLSTNASNDADVTTNGTPVQFVVNAEQMIGWHGRGSEVHSILGVPRRLAEDDAVFSFGGGLCTESQSIPTIKLQKGQSLTLGSHVSFPFSTGWAIQTWVHLPKEEAWLAVVRFEPFLLLMRTEADQVSFAIHTRQEAQPHHPSSFVQTHTATCPKSAPWIHVAVSGSQDKTVALYANGLPVLSTIRVPPTCKEIASIALGPDEHDIDVPPFAPKPHFSFVKIWNQLRSGNDIFAEYQRGFHTCMSHMSDPGLWAFYPLQGPPVLALCDVSAKFSVRHLHLTRHNNLAPLSPSYAPSAPRTSSQPADSPAFASLLTDDPLTGLTVFGPCWSQSPSLQLHPASSAWTRMRFPLSGGLQAAFSVSCDKQDAQVCLSLHGGTIWELVRNGFLPFQPFSGQVRVFLTRKQVTPPESSGNYCTLQVSIQVPPGGGKPFVHVPSTGLFTKKYAPSEPLNLELEYTPATRQLRLFAFNAEIISLCIDLESHLGLSGMDGVFVGISSTNASCHLKSLRVQGRRGQLDNALDLAATSLQLHKLSLTGGTDVSLSGLPSTFSSTSVASSSLASEWSCPCCTFVNPASCFSCSICNTPRPGGSTSSAAPSLDGTSDSQWICSTCTFANAAKAPTCGMCSTPNPNVSSNSATSSPPPVLASNPAFMSEWNCPTCTLTNPPTAAKCEICDTSRPATGPSDTSSSGQASSSSSTAVAPTPASTTSPTSGTNKSSDLALSEEDQQALNLVVDQRIDNLRHCVAALSGGSRTSNLVEPMDLTSEEHGFISVGSSPESFSTSQDWDTTFGVLHLQDDHGSTPTSEGLPQFAMVMGGSYGGNHGAMEVVARLSKEMQWCINGAWTNHQKGSDTGPSRVGVHLVEMKLDRAGERLTGRWFFGESASGEISAKLANDASMFRGLSQSLSQKSVVTSLQEMALQDAAKEAIRPVGDPALRFHPMHTGLANMEKGLTNVCYQNSLLQALFMTDEFRRALLFPPQGTLHANPLFSSLQRLFGNLLLSQRPVLVSKALQEALDMNWRTGQQMDVADFHDYIMSVLSESFPDGTLKDIFGCSTTQMYSCTCCSAIKSRKESELGLSVSLPRQYMPITDITAVSCTSKNDLHSLRIPDGFELLRVNLNRDKMESPCVFLCIKRDPDATPVSELVFKKVPGTDTAPTELAGYRRVPLNLNPGPSTPSANPETIPDQIYLFYQNRDGGSPITEIRFLVGDDEINSPPESFRVIPTNLNPSWASREVLVTPQEPSSGSNSLSLNFLSGSQSPAPTKRTIPAGPATTPVKLCYRRGMPITDVVVSHASPSGEAEYQVIDKPLNSSLESGADNGDVFLWVTESKSRGAPITMLTLVPEAQVPEHLQNGFELCGKHRFIGGRLLMSRRGEGCPLTQVTVFQSPRPAPLFRFHQIINVLTRDPVADSLLEELSRSKWSPVMSSATLATGGSNSSTKPAASDGSSVLSGQATGDAVPPEMIRSRGQALRLDTDPHGIRGVFVHGVYKGLGRPGSDVGTLAGIMYEKEPSSWDFWGFMKPSQGPSKVMHSLQFSYSGDTLHGSFWDSSNVNATTPVDVGRVAADRVDTKVSTVGPLEDVIVVREGETLPPGYSLVDSVSKDVALRNINLNSSNPAKTFLALRRSSHVAGNDCDPIVQVSLIMPEVESCPEGWEIKTHTVGGADANLLSGRQALPMYLCVKRRSAAPSKTTLVFNLALQWKDMNDSAPPGFTQVRQTLHNTAEANLANGTPHSLFLCVEDRAPLASVHSHEVNGKYKLRSANGDSAGSIDLFAVSGLRNGAFVHGGVESVSSFSQSPRTGSTAPIRGVALPLALDERASQLMPVPVMDRHDSLQTWVMCGQWSLQSAEPSRNCAPIVWRLSQNEVTNEFEAFWAWGGGSGTIHFVQDVFLQIACISDSTEMWSKGEQVFSDRSMDADVQSLVNGAFSSSVLSGNDMLLCDAENKKTVHLQHTLLIEPPKHLVLTVKRMGFDFKKSQPIKHLEMTRFRPLLRLPAPNEHLLSKLEADQEEMTLLEDKGDGDKLYGLYGVIVHTGANANSGHYFAYARHSCDNNLDLEDSPSSPWILFNDSRVQSVSWKEMTEQIELSESNTPYLLFYRRLGLQDEVSSLHSSDNKRRGNAVQFPVKKPRTADGNSEVEASESDVDIDMEEEDMLAQAIALSRQDAEETQSKNESGSVKEHVAQLTSLQNYALVPAWMRLIMDSNAKLLLETAENQTSTAYASFLQVFAERFLEN